MRVTALIGAALSTSLFASATLANGSSYKADEQSRFYVSAVAMYVTGETKTNGVRLDVSDGLIDGSMQVDRLWGSGAQASQSGAMGGIALGMRWTPHVAFEADLLAGQVGDDTPSLAETEVRHKPFYYRSAKQGFAYETSALASLRVKVNGNIGGFRPYLTTGVALQRLTGTAQAQIEFHKSDEGNARAGLGTEIQFGYTVGGGVDWDINERFSISAGYHYYHFNGELDGKINASTTGGVGAGAPVAREATGRNNATVDSETGLHAFRLNGSYKF